MFNQSTQSYKILISAMAYDGGKSGISVYIYNVIRALALAKHQLDVVVLPEDRESMPQHPNVNYLTISPLLKKPLINMLWHLLILPFRICWRKYDFVLLPAANRRAFWFYRKFTITVVHDLSQYHVDYKYDMLRICYIKHILPRAVRRSDRIVAVSGSTARDLKTYWHIPERKIVVNYNGFDDARFFVDPAFAPQPVRRRFSLRKDFIFYVSRIEHPGKNHLNLIKAFELLPETLRQRYDLVLGGSFWPGAEPVSDYAANSPDAASFKFIGFVENSVLPDLYRAATLYVFPSLFEGFGLSLVEAMACGTPTACSSNSSLGEIAGNAALCFDASRPAEISSAIAKLLTMPQLRKKLQQRGLKRVQDFNWNRHAAKLVDIYEKASL